MLKRMIRLLVTLLVLAASAYCSRHWSFGSAVIVGGTLTLTTWIALSALFGLEWFPSDNGPWWRA